MRARRGRLLTTLGVLAGTVLTLALPPGAAPVDRMVGGGSIDDDNFHVTLGTNVACAATGPGSELEINWFNPQPDPPGRESFHMSTMTTVECAVDDPDFRNSGGTHEGTGMGACT